MSNDNKANQAREGLMNSVKGKAKEIAGAVIGNDSLTAEGQLEQAQARERKEANITEAVADAEAAETLEQLVEVKAENARERAEIDTEAAALKGSIEAQQHDETRIAEQQGRQDVAAAAATAQIDAQREAQQARAAEEAEKAAAQEDLVEAAAEHETAERITDNAKSEAERLRNKADEITSQADLP